MAWPIVPVARLAMAFVAERAFTISGAATTMPVRAEGNPILDRLMDSTTDSSQ